MWGCTLQVLGGKGEVAAGMPVCSADPTAPSHRLLETSFLCTNRCLSICIRGCAVCQHRALGTATSLNIILAFSPLGCCVKACLCINVKMSLPRDMCRCSFVFSVIECVKEKDKILDWWGEQQSHEPRTSWQAEAERNNIWPLCRFFWVLFLGVYLEIKIFFLQKRRMKEGYLNQTRAGMLIAARPEKLARWVLRNRRGGGGGGKLVHAFL